MELKNKILVGGALCGALALNTEYAKQADEILHIRAIFFAFVRFKELLKSLHIKWGIKK